MPFDPNQPFDMAPPFEVVTPEQAGPAPQTRVTVGGPGQKAAPTGFDPSQPFDVEPTDLSVGDYAYDMGRAALTGTARGVAGLVGAPADIVGLGSAAYKGVAKLLTGERPGRNWADDVQEAAGSEAATRGIESVTGPLPKPETTAGKYVESAASFVPAAMLGPGNMARKAVLMGVAPGVTSEGAGQLTEGTEIEPYARAGAALLTGGVGAVLSRPSSAGREVTRALDGVTNQQMDAAAALMAESRQIGVPLSWPEAIQQATGGGTRLGDLQRVVEGSGGMRPFYAERAGQVDNAARRTFDDIVMPPNNPSGVGPAVARAAEGTINDTQGAINNATRPLYQQAERQRIDPQTFAQIRTDPVFQEGLQRVRNDPWIGPTLNGVPDDSVQVIDAVRKLLDETGRNLRNPGNADRNNFAASITGQGGDRLTQAADAATGSAPGVVGTYEAARNAQAQLRERYLAPLMDGPIGRIAEAPTTKAAIDALFPANPLANSAGEITTAVHALAQRNPLAARQLVRAHAESVFNEASQNLISGANQFGGAKFAAAIRGNPQQAANLEAAVRALPNGDAIWPGFDRYLEVLEATGQRQRIGSNTSFNNEALQELRKGGIVGEAATMAGGVGMKWPQRLKDGVERWRLGRNLDDLAELFANPEAAGRFRQLLNAPAGSTQAANIAGRLTAIAVQGYRNAGEPAPK